MVWLPRVGSLARANPGLRDSTPVALKPPGRTGEQTEAGAYSMMLLPALSSIIITAAVETSDTTST